MIRVVHPGSGSWFFTHPGSLFRSKRHRTPDPQHCYLLFFTSEMLWTLLLLLSGCPWLWPSSSHSWPSSWSTSSHPMIPGKFLLHIPLKNVCSSEDSGWNVPSQIISNTVGYITSSCVSQLECRVANRCFPSLTDVRAQINQVSKNLNYSSHHTAVVHTGFLLCWCPFLCRTY